MKRLAAVPGDSVDGGAAGRGECWVLGDNEDASTDSRIRPVTRRDLLGRAWVILLADGRLAQCSQTDKPANRQTICRLVCRFSNCVHPFVVRIAHAA